MKNYINLYLKSVVNKYNYESSPKSSIGVKAPFLRIVSPKLKQDVIMNIMRDTIKYLPRPSGRGLWETNKMGVLTPLYYPTLGKAKERHEIITERKYKMPTTNSHRKNQSGFTLIEMILVVLAIGIIGTMAASMLSQGSDIYKETVYRQSFLGQARSTFWRMGRESGLQRNAGNFTLSGANNFYTTNAKNETAQFIISGSNAVNYTANSGTTYPLSNHVKTSASLFRYYKNSNEEITLTSGETLTQSNADLIQLLYLDMVFKRDDDSIRFSSFIYPQNFRFGKKMSFHD